MTDKEFNKDKFTYLQWFQWCIQALWFESCRGNKESRRALAAIARIIMGLRK